MTARLAHICRHPIKAHGREDLASVVLLAGACLPFDRHWAVAHEAAQLGDGGWVSCTNFSRGAKAPALMAIRSQLDEKTQTVTLSHPERPDLTFRPDHPDDLPEFLAWVRPLCPTDRAQPMRIVSAGRGMTDSKFPSVSILGLGTHRALGQRMGQDLSIHRWRGNLWVEGTAPFEELDWIGRTLQIGETRLQVQEAITRCKATTANPDTGRIDADTLGALQAWTGRQDFGVYATVIASGPIRLGDTLEIV